MVSRAPALRRAAPVLLAALAVSTALAGCRPQAPGTASDDGATVAAGAAAGAAPASAAAASGSSPLAALAAIPVKGRAPLTGYTRDQFGSGWVDTDHNGCDTRNDVLRRDLTGTVLQPGTHDCVVLSGTLADPYSGHTIAFQRGDGTSSAVQIDHVVALGDAWQKGAQGWDAARRVAFANDPANLLAVDGPLNEQKGDGDAATWLPPDRSYRCAYVARQVAIKASYGLWMTQAEKTASATVLSACRAEPLPGGGTAAQPHQAAAPTPVPVPAPSPEAAVYYATCTAARAAGAAPLHRGDPGYRAALDRDGDGVACE